MKNILFFALLFLSLQPTFGQKIHFGNSSNTWCFIDSTSACCVPYPVHFTTAQYVDSTVYNGHFYRYLSTSIASVLIRKDSNRVYVIGTTDCTEYLLYDFNLTVHDTLRLIYPEDTFTSWVTTLDSTQMAGNWYKVWHFEGQDASTFYLDSIRPFQYNVIEGIGCTNGLYYPASPYSLVDFSQQIMCFKTDTNTVTGSLSMAVTSYGNTYTQSFDNSVSCDSFTNHYHPIVDNTGVTYTNEQSIDAKVIPNPVANFAKLVFPHKISGTLTLSNISGNVVSCTAVDNKSEVPIAQDIAIPGVYYYKITDIITGRNFGGRFVRQ